MRVATYAERYPTCKEAVEWHEQPEMEEMWDSLRERSSTAVAFSTLMLSAVVAMALVPSGPMAIFFSQMQTKEFYEYFCEKLARE